MMNKLLFMVLLAMSFESTAFCLDDEKQLQGMDKGVHYLLCGEADEAIEIFGQHLADNADAEYYMGKAYLLKAQDIADDGHQKELFYQGVQWLKLAANKQHPLAEYAIARLYLQGLAVPVNELLAEEWLLKSSQHGHIPAQVDLAILYATAKGSTEHPDYVRSYAWLSIAATNNDSGIKTVLNRIKKRMSQAQILQAQRLAKELQQSII